MKQFAILLLVAGACLLGIGLLLLALGKAPFLGRLPGDLRIEREQTTIYLPLATCLVLSVVLTLIANVLVSLFRK